MGFEIVVMPRARQDAIEIREHIAHDDPLAADRVLNELIERYQPLADFPELGRRVPDLKEIALRELIHRSYRIIYRVLPLTREIHILRFWHAARGQPKIN